MLVLGFLSFVVWAHHMWLTGMGSTVSAFFQTTTVLISIPSVIILSAFFISLWGGSIRFNVPMLFATAFLPMFGIGGLTGIPLAFNSADLYLHDTYYVIAHFHYIVAPGTIFALFAGVYYWFPKATGRTMNEFWGKVHFWPSFICMNVIFLPMFLQGMLNMHRRWYDGGQGWNLAARKGLGSERLSMEHADLLGGLDHGPGPDSVHHQFLLEHQARQESERQPMGSDHASNGSRRRHRHMVTLLRCPWPIADLTITASPARDKDYTMQNEPVDETERTRPSLRSTESPHWPNGMEIPYTVSNRPDTGLWNAKIGIWLFLASEVMLFGGLFSAYIFLRLDAAPGMWPHGLLNVPVGAGNTAILILSSVTVVLAWASLKMRRYRAYWWWMLITILCGVTFLVVKLSYEWPQKFEHFGALIKTEALPKYEKYLGNERRTEKGLEPRIEITGHLHNPEALNDPNAKEYRDRRSIRFTPIRQSDQRSARISSMFRPPKRSARSRRRMSNGSHPSVPGITTILRPTSPSPVCMVCTSSAGCWFLFICGCRSARGSTSATPSTWLIAWKSAAFSGTLSIWSGFLFSRSFICSKP